MLLLKHQVGYLQTELSHAGKLKVEGERDSERTCRNCHCTIFLDPVNERLALPAFLLGATLPAKMDRSDLPAVIGPPLGWQLIGLSVFQPSPIMPLPLGLAPAPAVPPPSPIVAR